MSSIAFDPGPAGFSGVAVLASAGGAVRRAAMTAVTAATSVRGRGAAVTAGGFYWDLSAASAEPGAGGGEVGFASAVGSAAPSAKAAPMPAMAPIAWAAPAGRRRSLLASPAATAGSASRDLYPSMALESMPASVTVLK